jgi:hypothetical protein
MFINLTAHTPKWYERVRKVSLFHNTSVQQPQFPVPAHPGTGPLLTSMNLLEDQMIQVRTSLVVLLSVFVASLLFLGTVNATADQDNEPSKQTKEKAKKEDKKKGGTSAMKVGKDPSENTPRPLTRSEEKALSEKLQKKMKELPRPELETRKDGTKILRVAPDHLSFSMVSTGKDGKLVHTCMQNGRQITHKVEDHKKPKPEPLPEE